MKKSFSDGWVVSVVVSIAVLMICVSCGKNSMVPTSAVDSGMVKVAAVSGSAVTATAGGAWVNTAFTAPTGDYTINFTASASASPTNGIIGLSNAAQTAYANFSALVRFNPTGDIDAYDGGAANYVGPSTAIPYSANTAYNFTLTIHSASQTYDVSVNSKVVGTGLKFRAAATSLNNYGAFISTSGGSGNLTVSGFSVVTPTPTSTPSFTATATTALVSTWRVHAGGSAYTDTLGNIWAADENFTNGTVGSVSTSTIAGTSDPSLYQTQRYGSTFTYSFPVPNGAYQVTLKFMENKFTAAGGRVFNVAINGTAVLTNFDIFATAGAANKALDEVFNNVTVSNGVLSIDFGPSSANYAKIDAIQVIPQPILGTATNTPTNTNTSTFTSTFTITDTPTWTNTPTVTNTPTWTNTATNTFTATDTFTSTSTPTFTFTRTPTSTFTATNTPTKTATPSPALNINFSQWYLQEPSGSGTSPTTRANTWLEAGNSDSYFYKATDGWQAYMDTKTGITTSGSQHPRCEMHEESTWGTSGTNTLTVTGKVTLIDGDTTTIAQIFNNNEGTLIELQYSKSLGGFKVFYEEVKGSGSYPTQTTVYAPMNSAYTFQLALTGGVAKVTINGQVALTHTLSSAVSGDQFYFKAGNYDQSATAGAVSTTPYSIVEIGSAVIVHK